MGVPFRLTDFAPAALTLASAVPVAVAIDLVTRRAIEPGTVATPVMLLLGTLLVIPAVLYGVARRASARPATLGLIVVATISTLFVAVYLYRVRFYVTFPSDILIWSESDFVNDIVKLRAGYPLYTAQQNNESFVYMPGTQILTYVLARAAGAATSIPVYRGIQIGFTILAAVVAMLCCRPILEMSNRRVAWGAWGAVWLPVFVLIASNGLTNPFAHNLHNAALAQLVSMTTYLAFVRYLAAGSRRALTSMAVLPAAGFMVRQDLAIWAFIFCAYLMVERTLRPRGLAIFALAALGGIAAVIGTGYALWREHFIFWTITVPAHDPTSFVRAGYHLVRAWPYLAIGLLGGFVLVRGPGFSKLVAAWTAWLCLLVTEAYTSSIAWMLHHLGPASLIAGIWFMAAVAALWPVQTMPTVPPARPRGWVRAGSAVLILLLAFSGLAIVRMPVRPVSDDAYRYPAEIEKAFEGHRADAILLDVGSWMYLRSGVVMKDRAANLGNRGLDGIADFSGIRRRFEEKRYDKILVRSLHDADFWYDHYLWPRSSGLRRTLLENYREVGRIQGVVGLHGARSYTFRDISILVPAQGDTDPDGRR